MVAGGSCHAFTPETPPSSISCCSSVTKPDVVKTHRQPEPIDKLFYLLPAPECQMPGSEAWSYYVLNYGIKGENDLVAGGICRL